MSDNRDEFVLSTCVLSQLCMDFFKPFFWLVKSFIVFDFDKVCSRLQQNLNSAGQYIK